MKIALLSREYPPESYGGAGVHVEFLAREMRKLIDVEVHCFGATRNEPGVHAWSTSPELANANPALQTLSVDLQIAAALGSAPETAVELVHSHTWYANFAGVLASQLYGVPHVVTAHSLEPLRPWKSEQLGGGYRVSSWIEEQAYAGASAVIAVSQGMREDVLAAYPSLDPARVHVIGNGIDTALYSPVTGSEVLAQYGINPARPIALFVGRITRQKGLTQLLAAAEQLSPEIQLVLCAGAPDTPELEAETAASIARLSQSRTGVVWIKQMLPRAELVQLLSHASVFVCPSIYEPLGIVNLEAMACETAVVASDVGGIPEVVVDGVTGLLVPRKHATDEEFAASLAAAINLLCSDPERAAKMGRAGRQLAAAEFSWTRIAEQSVELYKSLL